MLCCCVTAWWVDSLPIAGLEGMLFKLLEQTRQKPSGKSSSIDAVESACEALFGIRHFSACDLAERASHARHNHDLWTSKSAPNKLTRP